MFAALSENPDFFRPRMKVFIAVAPILLITQMEGKVMKEHHAKIVAILKATGPSVLPIPGSGNRMADFILGTSLGLTGFGKFSEISTDGNSDIICE